MPANDPYEEARRRFRELEVEERARFLVDSSVSLLAEGLEQAGRVLADGLEQIIREMGSTPDSAGTGERPGPAEPETAERRTPRNGGSSPDS